MGGGADWKVKSGVERGRHGFSTHIASLLCDVFTNMSHRATWDMIVRTVHVPRSVNDALVA